jgi:hypothetical protein
VVLPFRTRRKYIHVGSGSASMPHTVLKGSTTASLPLPIYRIQFSGVLNCYDEGDKIGVSPCRTVEDMDVRYKPPWMDSRRVLQGETPSLAPYYHLRNKPKKEYQKPTHPPPIPVKIISPNPQNLAV